MNKCCACTKVDQGGFAKRTSYIFKYKRPVDIAEKEAKLLIVKYNSLYETDDRGSKIVKMQLKTEEKVKSYTKVETAKESIKNDMVTDIKGHRSNS